MTPPARRPPVPGGADEPATTPRADCVADVAGGLTFDVTDEGGPCPAQLLLRRRGGQEEVRLPLTPAGGHHLRAALPAGVALPEGRWDAYLRAAGAEPRRLAPGLNDLRSLVDRAPTATAERIAVRIPYATKHGNLSVRSWERAPHAEAGALHIGDGELTVSARLYGTGPAPDAYAEAADRHGTFPPVRADVAPAPGGLRFTVSYGALRPGLWDLWLRPGGAAGPRVRIARLLDDIVDKKPVYVYPTVGVDTEHGPVEATPYYTADNDLSVTVAAVG
ncbi:hypothetical protein [Streptomyces sp. HM190]|uniref:hypothetical protein n=1 Tax=Streptomyces sp. HM190 TaxID=2695266 RepID=UPI001358D5A6|nr:hypothetical protein [Streptomyces sp. HM190]